jgi:uncharacterized membrane protein
MSYVVPYVIALVVFLAVDFVWLSTVGRTVYVAEIGSLLKDKPDLVSAFLFYLLFIAGLVAFVIAPALAANSLRHALIFGAFFGLVTYATYDMTNLATLKGYTTRIAIIDMVWGSVLSASVSAVTYSIVTWIRGSA